MAKKPHYGIKLKRSKSAEEKIVTAADITKLYNLKKKRHLKFEKTEEGYFIVYLLNTKSREWEAITLVQAKSHEEASEAYFTEFCERIDFKKDLPDYFIRPI